MSIIAFTNKKLKKIVNVYQLDYCNGKSPGLGDYLRGCFCLMQVSKLLNIEFDLDISQHPLSKYIDNPIRVDGIDYNNIKFYTEVNRRNGANNYENVRENVNKDFLNHIINYLNCQNGETCGLFSNAYPCFNTHLTDGKEFIKSRLRPSNIMMNYVDYTLKNLNLSKNGYGVIHIRTGDNYLVNNAPIDINFINRITNLIKKFIKQDRRYLIISDCNILKSHLKSIPNLYIYVKPIEHLGGEGIKSTETNGVMNTMLDFFLMEYSNAILSLSIYDHVSGFSKFCSIINNIPFNYIKI